MEIKHLAVRKEFFAYFHQKENILILSFQFNETSVSK